MTNELFKNNPRAYALELVEELGLNPVTLLSMALQYMSQNEVRELLDLNELSPRFDEEYED